MVLRVALGQPDALPEWSQIEQGVSSALIVWESLRTLDRFRLRVELGDAEVAKRRATILELIASLEIVEINLAVLERAAQPMPTELEKLEAIYLASALLWKEINDVTLVVATHDRALGLGAKAHGFEVIGVRSA